jgi:uncharacterized protein (TIGR02466 family)
MIENVFPIKIYRTSFNEDLEILKKIIIPNLSEVFDKTKHNNQGSMRGSGLCSYNVERKLHLLPEMNYLVSFINSHVKKYWNDLGYINSEKVGVFEMWANIYEPGSFIDIHNHSPIPMTASFYLQKDEGSGNIVFENPLETLLKHQPIDLTDRNNYHRLFNQELIINEGDLVIFPGWLKHSTLPNSSKNNRIIIGANIMEKSIWGQ